MAKKDTYQLLKQWLRGAAGYREEQALGRQAEQDEFLADAMEGYNAMPEGEHAESVQRLKQRVREQSRRKRRAPAYWLRVAAAVLLIGFAGGLFWYLNQPTQGPLSEKMNPVEEDKEEADINNIGAAKLDSLGQSTEAITAREESAPENAAAQPTAPSITRKREEPSFSDDAAPIAPLPSASTEPPAEEAEADMVAADRLESEPLPDLEETAMPAFNDTDALSGQEPERKDVEPPVSAAEEKERAAIAMPDSKSPPPPKAYHFDGLREEQKAGKQEDSFVLQGKVVEQSTGAPLIAANVRVVGTEEGTITDLDGNFSLEVSGDSAEIAIDYVGFQSYNLTVERGDTVEIGLPESEMALQEVVVTSQGISSKRKAKAQKLPEPVDGFRKFRKYVRQNLRYPESAKQASIRGKVELSFAIDRNGRPLDIKVEKSLAYGCDEEAIRLLKEGPGWEAGKGRGRYTFKFP